jgi:hypothetical protein
MVCSTYIVIFWPIAHKKAKGYNKSRKRKYRLATTPASIMHAGVFLYVRGIIQ